MGSVIKADTIFLEDRILEDGYIVVEDGHIQSVMEGGCGGETIDLRSLTLVPGFLDIHVHGGDMCDTMDASYESLSQISLYKLKEGVTSFCPTTVTTSFDKTKKVIEAIYDAMDQGVQGAHILGTFVEGPYISPQYKGAHAQQFIRDVNTSEIEALIQAGKGSIRSFAIAPELPGAAAAIKCLKRHNINVRIGHSAATYAQANMAIEKGANIGIHTYNAMSPFGHRELGMVGAILDNVNIYGEVICDFIHINPAAVHVLLKCKGPDKVILITDCMMAGGAPDGEYTLGELSVVMKDGVCLTKDGVLAGSTLRMNAAIRNVVNDVNVSLYSAVKMASIVPARALGVDTMIGSIKAGKKADLVGLDDNMDVKFVMLAGKVVINKT